MGQVLLSIEEPKPRSDQASSVIADRSTLHRILGLERVKDRPLNDRALNLEIHVAIDDRRPAPAIIRVMSPNTGYLSGLGRVAYRTSIGYVVIQMSIWRNLAFARSLYSRKNLRLSWRSGVSTNARTRSSRKS